MEPVLGAEPPCCPCPQHPAATAAAPVSPWPCPGSCPAGPGWTPSPPSLPGPQEGPAGRRGQGRWQQPPAEGWSGLSVLAQLGHLPGSAIDMIALLNLCNSENNQAAKA